MTQGKAITEDFRWVVIHLSSAISAEDIATYLDIGIRSVEQILADFRKMDTVFIPRKPKRPPHQLIEQYDIQVCFALALYP
jgi:predicted glycosyltransferase